MPAPRLDGRHVLVAEDDEINALIAQRFLERQGARVTRVADGAADLSAGAEKLDAGATSAATGATALSDGATNAATGAQALSAGAGTLGTADFERLSAQAFDRSWVEALVG